MPRKRHKPEEIVAKLRRVDVLVSQGQWVADAIRAIGVTEVTYYGWPLIIRDIDQLVELTPKIATHAARSRCVCIIVSREATLLTRGIPGIS